jgi:predicted lipopolysaccharide heptosyltransferase III
LKRPDPFFRTLGPAPRILLIRLRSLGDVVLMTPALESIHQTRPDALIDVVVEHPFSEALYGNPFVRRLLELKSPRHNSPPVASSSTSAGAFLTKLQALANIRRARYDAVWDLHGGSTSAWLTALSGARYRIGCKGFRHQFAYNVRIPDSSELLGRRQHHTVERTLAWFDWLNGESRTDFSDAPSLNLVVDEAVRDSARRRLSKAGIDLHSRYAVVQPAAVFDTKEWMADRFAAVADFLAAQGMQVVLTGAPHDRTKLEAVRSAMRVPAAIFSDLAICELVAVIDECSLFLGNDSGPAHIAAAQKRPAIVLFGSSNATAWAPWKTHSAVVQNSFECNPCAGYSCWKYAEPECIKSITVEQVKAAVERILREEV